VRCSFFFSSRRRHTRSKRDWSSDVCSSDLLRPADAEETVVAWKMALEEHRPVALILSRQNIRNLPTLGRSRREEAMQAAKGAYRSEERRVGKECRSRGTPEHEETNTTRAAP